MHIKFFSDLHKLNQHGMGMGIRCKKRMENDIRVRPVHCTRYTNCVNGVRLRSNNFRFLYVFPCGTEHISFLYKMLRIPMDISIWYERSEP